jgi:hypothetical protein
MRPPIDLRILAFVLFIWIKPQPFHFMVALYEMLPVSAVLILHQLTLHFAGLPRRGEIYGNSKSNQ